MKIELERARFRNFLSFGSRWQEVEFLPGVNVVLGHDYDRDKSNGSGKSSLMEVIPFCLFGQVHKNIKKDQITNWKSRRACEVSLNFKKGNKNYEVTRGIKPSKFEIKENGNLIDKPHTIKLYQEILDEIIGLNFQTFMSLIHSNINSSSPILAMKKPEKRKFIEKIFGLEFYTKLDKLCSEKRKIALEKIREVDITYQYNERSISESRSRINDLKERMNYTSFHELKSELNETTETLDKLRDKCENSEDNLRNIQLKIEYVESKSNYFEHICKNIKACISKVRSNTRMINSEIRDIELIEEENKEKIEKSKEVQKLIEEYGDTTTLEKEIEDFDLVIESLKSDIDDEQKEKNRLRIEHSKIKLIYEDCSNKLMSLKGKSICPTCGQKVDDSCDIKIELEKTIEESQDEINYLLDDMTSIARKIDDFKESISNCKKSKFDIRNIKDKILRLQAESSISSIDRYSRRKEKLKLDKEKYERVKEKLEISLRKHEKITDKLLNNFSLLKEEKEKIKREIDNLDKLEKRIEILQEKLEIEEKNRKNLDRMISEERIRAEKMMKENSVSIKRKEKMQEVIDYFEYIRKICKDENVKQFAISSKMPYINKQTNHYLSEVNYGFYVVLDKWLEAEIKGPGIVNSSYGSLSSGESRGIDIALQFAFLDIARVQAGVFPDILVFDELLDSSVDGQGIGKLMEILKTKQQEENLKLFLISHRPEIDEVEVDNTYLVEKKNGYSSVRII